MCDPRYILRRRPRRAFTLVELLAVVGIVVLLIGLLLPALGKARRHAGIITCASNLRQLGVAWNNYLAESRGRFPRWQQNLQWFYGGKHPSGYNLADPFFSKNDRLLNPYIGGHLKGDQRVFIYRCPFDGPIYDRLSGIGLTNGQDTYDWLGNSYMLNFLLLNYDNPWTPAYDPSPVRVTSVRFPLSQVILAGDCQWYYTINRTSWNADFHKTQPKLNLLFLDGHVCETVLVPGEGLTPDYSFGIAPGPDDGKP
jgi:prepilin-type processing-associated H-X9-DG protein